MKILDKILAVFKVVAAFFLTSANPQDMNRFIEDMHKNDESSKS